MNTSFILAIECSQLSLRYTFPKVSGKVFCKIRFVLYPATNTKGDKTTIVKKEVNNMTDSRKLTSGDPAPSKGEYKIMEANGVYTGKTVSIEKRGDTLPPTPKKDQYFVKI